MHSVSTPGPFQFDYPLTGLAAKRFLANLMGAPIRNKKQLGTLTCLIVGGTAMLFFLLRVIARLPIFGGNWGLDDWVMTAAMVRPQDFKKCYISGLTSFRSLSSQKQFALICVSDTTW